MKISADVNIHHPINYTFLFPEAWDAYWYVTAGVIVTIAAAVGFFLLSNRYTSGVPGRTQSVLELAVSGLRNQAYDVLGSEGMKYFPVAMGIGLYTLLFNVGDIVPFLIAPTSSLNATLAPALFIFVLYNYIGIRKYGLHYFKRFLGPVPAMAPLMLPIEIISHIARPVTLAVRLFGNIMGGGLLLLILLALVPIGFPVALFFIEGLKVVLQAYVFMLLSMVYIGTALEDDH